jgi:hypothetical protein
VADAVVVVVVALVSSGGDDGSNDGCCAAAADAVADDDDCAVLAGEVDSFPSNWRSLRNHRSTLQRLPPPQPLPLLHPVAAAGDHHTLMNYSVPSTTTVLLLLIIQIH